MLIIWYSGRKNIAGAQKNICKRPGAKMFLVHEGSKRRPVCLEESEGRKCGKEEVRLVGQDQILL